MKPKLLERKKIVPRVLDKIVGFVDKFYDGVSEYSSQQNNMNYVGQNTDVYSGQIAADKGQGNDYSDNK